MKISEHYMKTEFDGVPYLIPTGQGAAERKRPLGLNSTALFLWDELQNIPELSRLSKEEVISCLVERVREKEPDAPSKEALEKDMEVFLNALLSYGVLEHTKAKAEPDAPLFQIGRVVIRIVGGPTPLPKELDAFRMDTASEPDLTVFFDDSLLIRDPEMNIACEKEGYTLSFPNSFRIDRILLTADGREAHVFSNGPSDAMLRSDFFQALRALFSFSAQKKEQFLLHSASLLYRGKAWLFSAPSGTGKSTHTALWKKLWPEKVEDLNGDLNLLSMDENGSFTAEGVPWSGTSGIYRNGSFPLGGIVFLSQEPYNEVKKRAADRQALSLTQRLISPFWTEELMKKNIAFANALVKKVPIFYLSCTEEDEAAVLMRRAIDETLDSGKR